MAGRWADERDATPSSRGLAALRRRERTVAELARVARASAGSTARSVEVAIDRLTEVGELDDERFARRFAEDKRELRGWGAERIREALLAPRRRPRELVEAALAGRRPRRAARAGRRRCSRDARRLDSTTTPSAPALSASSTRRGYELRARLRGDPAPRRRLSAA